MSLMEKLFLKYESDFEDIWYRLANFKESERRAADFENAENITVNIVSLHTQEKKSGYKKTTVILVSMDMETYYTTQCTNAHAQKWITPRMYPWVLWNNLF